MTAGETTMLSNAAERGNDGAQLLLAIEYLHGGGGVKKDEKLAAYWLEHAGALGNSTAQLMLSDLYEQGLGAPRDLNLSAQWRTKAANRGNTTAQLKLGRMYLAGNGVEKDLEKAEYWLNRASVEGNGEAQFLLGRMYLQRNANERDRKLAGNLLAQSASQGFGSAVEFIKFMQEVGFEFSELLHNHPVDIHQMAADGDMNSQYQLATRYESGHLEKKNDERALYWFHKAAENGNQMAMKSLAQIYQKGLDGVAVDAKTAKHWADKASEK
jgi:TPR repeat protein